MITTTEAKTAMESVAEQEFHSFTTVATIPPTMSDQVRGVSYDYWTHLVRTLRKLPGSQELFQALYVEHSIASTFARESTSIPGEFSFKLIELMEIAGEWNTALRDALHDLDNAATEAHEEGFPIPSHAALTNARLLLLAMYRLWPRRFEIYPTMDGEIAIDAPSSHGCSVVTLCASDGGALCLVNIDGKHRRARYADSSWLPDGFVREALEELAQRDGLTA